MTKAKKQVKLSKTQTEVMKWLGKKWPAYRSHGDVYTVNGQKLCTLSTLLPLERAGLVAKGEHDVYTATEAGRLLTQELGL